MHFLSFYLVILKLTCSLLLRLLNTKQTAQLRNPNIIYRKLEWHSLLPQGILLSGSPDWMIYFILCLLVVAYAVMLFICEPSVKMVFYIILLPDNLQEDGLRILGTFWGRSWLKLCVGTMGGMFYGYAKVSYSADDSNYC